MGIKHVIIGDLHGRDCWQEINIRKYDKVVFLGDYVDSHTLSDLAILENLKKIIRPMKKWLDIKFYSKTAHPEKPVIKSVKSGNKFENHIRLSMLNELKPAIFIYVRESYKLI